MIDIMVYCQHIFIGTLTVPKPPENELITLYEGIPHKNKGPLNILYFQDLDYGILITDKMVNYVNELEQMI